VVFVSCSFALLLCSSWFSSRFFQLEEAKLAEMAAFQRAGEAALQNMERSRKVFTRGGVVDVVVGDVVCFI